MLLDMHNSCCQWQSCLAWILHFCVQALQEKGHTVEATDWGAVIQGILVDPSDGCLTGVSDPRKDGAPAGF